MGKGNALVVTLSGERPADEVARDLKAAGFEVGDVLHDIGVVTGFGPPDAAERLRAIQGVADVSADHPVDIGPPDAPVS